MDNGSVYTPHLTNHLANKKIQFKTLNTDSISDSEWKDYDSFILSGRRKNSQKMNSLNSKIIKHAVSQKLPLLGICYGAEILALTLGGTIKKMNSLKKGLHKVSIPITNPLCRGEITIFESHSYEISSLGEELKPVASSNDCKYEIIQHKTQNVFGTQFHPEMSDDGKKIIEKFVSL